MNLKDISLSEKSQSQMNTITPSDMFRVVKFIETHSKIDDCQDHGGEGNGALF